MSAALFAQARDAYLAAKQVCDDYDVANGMVSDLPAGPERSAVFDAIPRATWDAAEKLADLRYAAEDALMAAPCPNGTAFALKYLVAFGGGRQTDCWDSLLEREAVRLLGADAASWRSPPVSAEPEPFETAEEAVNAQLAAGAKLLVTPGGSLEVGASLSYREFNADDPAAWEAMRIAQLRFDATIERVRGAKAAVIAIIRALGARTSGGWYCLKGAPAPEVTA